jgi:EpsI family protein
MTALVLGVLYAHLNFSSWKKRVVAVLLALGVPVIANGIRVYITIAVSHMTHMQFGPGAEHVRFAQVFFIAVLLGMFWLGLRWREPEAGMPKWLRELPDTTVWQHSPSPFWPALVTSLAILLAAPAYQRTFAEQLRERSSDAAAMVRLPKGRSGWEGPLAGEDTWSPLFRDGLADLRGRYVDSSGQGVDAFVAVYGLGATSGAEMINYENVLFAEEHATVPQVVLRSVEVGEGRSLSIREVRVPSGDGGHLVWHWYMLGDSAVTNEFAVKALEAVAWITRDAAAERIVTLATPLDDQARDRLESFVAAHAACVASGFSTGACGE